MGKIIFILGGARSGKSQFAIKLAKRKPQRVAFIATCSAQDKEMKKRICLHKKSRPSDWQTFEELHDLAPLLKKIGRKFDIIIIDCLTLWISNLLIKGINGNVIENKAKENFAALRTIKGKSIIVSNEVGLGIVPVNKLARDFRDIAGRVNQIAVGESNEVFLLVSGIPLKIK
ncbi:MAG: bifunctional adenosylcobinamide kinase/adenosylcobinamide-phosphate guanylyltransferase [Candidatus Omnitrophota bacterium]